MAAGEILLKADKMCMAHSLELRVPFLDKKVMEFAQHIPARFRVNDQGNKQVLRHAANRILPDEWATRPKKGFVPLKFWLREQKYYDYVKEYFTAPWAEEFFDTGKLMSMLDEHFEGRVLNHRKIYTALTFLNLVQALLRRRAGRCIKRQTQKASRRPTHLPDLPLHFLDIGKWEAVLMRTDLRVKHDIEPGIAAIRFFVCSGAMRPRSTFVFPPCALQHCCKKSGCGRFFAGMPHNIVRLRIGVFRDLGKRIPRAAPAAFFGLKLRHTRKKRPEAAVAFPMPASMEHHAS